MRGHMWLNKVASLLGPINCFENNCDRVCRQHMALCESLHVSLWLHASPLWPNGRTPSAGWRLCQQSSRYTQTLWNPGWIVWQSSLQPNLRQTEFLTNRGINWWEVPHYSTRCGIARHSLACRASKVTQRFYSILSQKSLFQTIV